VFAIASRAVSTASCGLNGSKSLLDASKVLGTYHAAAARAGLPSRPFHHLRHFAAKTLLEAGEDLYTVSRVLGPASITTTADVYGHVTPATLRRSAERMDEAMAR
jgi:integrase